MGENSVTISGELEIFPVKTEKSVKLEEFKVVPYITKDIFSLGVLLQDGD